MNLWELRLRCNERPEVPFEDMDKAVVLALLDRIDELEQFIALIIGNARRDLGIS